MDQRPMTFTTGTGTIEAVMHTPDRGDARALAFVVCHPHPQYGGDMNNNVVLALVRGMVAAGHAAVRFNFRGVGGSSGGYDGGAGEADDLRAIVTQVAERAAPGPVPVAVAGYSFGAWVAATVAADQSVPALVLVAPPLSARMDAGTALKRFRGPVLLLAGDSDPVCPRAALEELAREMRERARVHIEPGMDHFWAGRERTIEQMAAAFAGGLAVEHA